MLDLSMSTSSQQDDWRAEALRNMELADQPVEQPKRRDGWLALVATKLVLLVLFSIVLIYFLGWGFLIAPAFAAWFLFWPR